METGAPHASFRRPFRWTFLVAVHLRRAFAPAVAEQAVVLLAQPAHVGSLGVGWKPTAVEVVESASAFAGYGEERAERMRRAAGCPRGDPSPGLLRARGRRRRRRWFDSAAADPSMLAPLLAPLVGPDRVGAKAFTDDMVERVLSA